MDAAAELGRNPVRKHQIQPEYGDEQADAGRDCRTRLARPNSQARTRTGKYSIFSVQLTTCRTGNLTRLMHTYIVYHYFWGFYSIKRGRKQPPCLKSTLSVTPTWTLTLIFKV